MKRMFSLILMAALAGSPALLHAQDTTKKAPGKTVDRKALRDRWKNATPEQKEKAKEKAKEMKAKYDSLPPEKQQELKDKMKERREKRKASTK
jgi:Ni/Co efflux regulator RcnB